MNQFARNVAKYVKLNHGDSTTTSERHDTDGDVGRESVKRPRPRHTDDAKSAYPTACEECSGDFCNAKDTSAIGM